MPHEVDQYRVNGFLVIPDFLNDAELHDWRLRADAAVAAAPPTEHFSIRCSNLSQSDPEWAKLLRDTRLAKLVADLENLSAVRHSGDSILYHQPGCPATPYHCGLHDGTISDTRQGVNIWVQLDACDLQSKAYVWFPGTHLTAPFGQRYAASPASVPRSFDSIYEEFPEWKKINPIVTEGPAGCAVFWNSATVHGSGPNMTAQLQRVVGTTFLPADATWNGASSKRLPEAARRRLQVGDVLDLPEMPIVWSV